MTLHIRLLEKQDIPEIAAAFARIGWDKPASQYEHYLAEQIAGERTVFVAFEDGVFAGYATIKWESDYAPFRADQIPEIKDFNVLPHFQRQGIGTRLMDVCEQTVAERAPVVGLGVGLYAGYGAAQQLYTRRGYILDGRGIAYHGEAVPAGEQVTVNDNLTLFLTKPL